ncbi:zinc finger protein 711-like isoform X9 [Anticarsia gemmatalis]|uniref:zinc finger protein 711-like isoform X9 n=1 Tax=Anticarsia gemmatalis TaxID=129554 RepID=UPI003F763F55
MESSLLNGMCRCCASEGVFKDVKTAYTWMGEEEVYADMLKQCFDICLSTSEQGDDGGICEVCITQLRNAANFKKQVLTTEEQFKKHALSKLFKPSIIKLEVSPEDDNDSDDNALSGDDGYSGPEFEVPIKTEVDDPKPKKRAAASKASTSRAKKAKADNGETSTKRTLKGDTVKTKIQATKTSYKLIPTLKEVDKHRGNIRQVLLWSNATAIRRHGDRGYSCCYCQEQYHDPSELKSHTLESHPDVHNGCFMRNRMSKFDVRLDITGLKCKICNQNIDTIETLVQHLKDVHEKNLFTDIKNHMIPFKFDKEILECCICMKNFVKFRTLMEHMHIHFRNYICELCDSGFVNEQSMKSHIATHSTGAYKCDHCDAIFGTMVKKRTHEKLKHTNKRIQIKCGYCNESFEDYRRKEAHLIATHGLIVPTSKCNACDKVFKDRKRLTLHIKRDHLMDKRHKCPECDMRFFQSTELKDHIVKHIGSRDFKCSVCSKAFPRAKSLKEHLKIHDDVRRFKCEHCGHTFVQKCSWRSHMKNKHKEIV